MLKLNPGCTDESMNFPPGEDSPLKIPLRKFLSENSPPEIPLAKIPLRTFPSAKIPLWAVSPRIVLSMMCGVRFLSCLYVSALCLFRYCYLFRCTYMLFCLCCTLITDRGLLLLNTEIFREIQLSVLITTSIN